MLKLNYILVYYTVGHDVHPTLRLETITSVAEHSWYTRTCLLGLLASVSPYIIILNSQHTFKDRW
jgi:hypothetical protein